MIVILKKNKLLNKYNEGQEWDEDADSHDDNNDGLQKKTAGIG